MPSPDLDHPAQHHRVQHMPQEMRAEGQGIAERLIQRAEDQRDDQDPGADGEAARRFRQAFAQQSRIDQDQKRHRRIACRGAEAGDRREQRHRRGGIGDEARRHQGGEARARPEIVAGGREDIEQDEGDDGQHIHQPGQPVGMGVEQPGADADHEQRRRQHPAHRHLRPPQPRPQDQGGDQEGQVCHRIDRLGPVFGTGPFAIGVNRGKPGHRNPPGQRSGCSCAGRSAREAGAISVIIHCRPSRLIVPVQDTDPGEGR